MILKRMLLLFLLLTGLACSGPLTLPLDQRPDWLSEDGIVMAGSWEPVIFRVRRDGSEGYTPTAEQREACRITGVDEVVFLGEPDGMLVATLVSPWALRRLMVVEGEAS